MNQIDVLQVDERRLLPKRPFHFAGTVHKPSHFPSPDNAYDGTTYWQTMNFRGQPLGLQFDKVHGGGIDLRIFAEASLSQAEVNDLVTEIRWRFDLDADLKPFNKLLSSDAALGPVVNRWRGMRVSCAYSLYEFLIISIVLQNATVRRSVQMLDALFRAYGKCVSYGGQALYVFWSPEDIADVTEDELRSLKVGYRAKFIRRITDQFLDGQVDEMTLRRSPKDAVRSSLLSLYGIGPASVGMLLFEVFHHYDAFDMISPWEQKILSKRLFDKDIVVAPRILNHARRRWKSWRMLAVHYLFEDLFWRHRQQPVDWLTPLIRL